MTLFKRVKPGDVPAWESVGWKVSNGVGNAYSEGHGITILMTKEVDRMDQYKFPGDLVQADKTEMDRYGALRRVLEEAVAQAETGKGKERHAGKDEAFEDQQIVQLCEWMGSNHGDIFQACKKAIESTRLPKDRARHELLGAINFLAAAVIVLDRGKTS